MDRWGVRLFLIVDLTTALSKLVLLLSIFLITCSRTLGARHVIFNTLFLYLGGSGITFKEYACEFYSTYLIPFLSLYPLLLTTYTKIPAYASTKSNTQETRGPTSSKSILQRCYSITFIILLPI